MLTEAEKLHIIEEEKFRSIVRKKADNEAKGKKAFVKFILTFILGIFFPPLLLITVVQFFKTLVSVKYFVLALLIVLIPGTVLMNLFKYIAAVAMKVLINGNI